MTTTFTPEAPAWSSYRQTPSRGVMLRITAEQRRDRHAPDLMGRCRVDGQPHPCYDHAAAGLMLSSIAEIDAPPPSGSGGAVALVVAAVLAVASLATMWLWWA